MATTEVILREKIDGLGAEADVVRVKAGYARNFLLPSGKAYEATAGNLRHLDSLKAARAQREAQDLADAHDLATKIEKLNAKFTLETGQGGKAFGSITSQDLHGFLESKKIPVARHDIKLPKALKSTGKSEVEIKLHPEVTATLKVTVDAAAKEEKEEESAE